MSFYESGKFKVYVVRKDKPTPTSINDFIEYNDYFDECTVEGGIGALGGLFATFSGRINTPSPKGDSGTLGSDLTEGNFIYIIVSNFLAIKARVITATFSLEGQISVEGIQSCGIRQGVNLDKDEYDGSEFNNAELEDLFTSTVWNERGILIDDTNTEIVHSSIADSSKIISFKISPQSRISAVVEVLKNSGHEWVMTHGDIDSAVPFSAGDTLTTSDGWNVQSAGTTLNTLYLSGDNNNCMPSKNSEKDETVVNDVIIKGFDKKNTPLISNLYHSTDTHRTTITKNLDDYLLEDMPPYKSAVSESQICKLKLPSVDNALTDGTTYLFKIDNEYMVGEYNSSQNAFINVVRGQSYLTTRSEDISVCKSSAYHRAGAEVIILSLFDLITFYPGAYMRIMLVESTSLFTVNDFAYLGGEKIKIQNYTTSGPAAIIFSRSIFPDDVLPSQETFRDKFSDNIYAHTKDMYVWDAQYTKYNPEPSPDTNSIIRNGLQSKTYYAKSNYSRDELDHLAIKILQSLDNNISNYTLEVPEANNVISDYLVGSKVNVEGGSFLGISDGVYRIINTTLKLPENILGLELANEDYRAYVEDSSHFGAVKEKSGEPWEFMTGFSAKHVRTEGETSQIAGKPIFKWKNDGEGKFSTNYTNSEDAWDYFGTSVTDREFEDYDSEIATVGFVKAAAGGSGPGGLWTEETTNLYPYTDRNILPFTTEVSSIGSETHKWLSVNALTSNSYTVNTEQVVGQFGTEGKLLLKSNSSFGEVWFIAGSDSIAYINSSGFTLGQGVLAFNQDSGIVGNQKIIFGKNADYSDNCAIRVNSTSGNLEYTNDSGAIWQEFNSIEGKWQDLGLGSIETQDDRLIKITYFDDSITSPSDSNIGLMYQNGEILKWRSDDGWQEVGQNFFLKETRSGEDYIYPKDTVDENYHFAVPYDSGTPIDPRIGTVFLSLTDSAFYGYVGGSTGWTILSPLWGRDSNNMWPMVNRNVIPYAAGANLGGTITGDIWEDVNYYGLSNSRTSSGTLVGSIGADSADSFWQINGIYGMQLSWAQTGTGTSDRRLWFLGDSIYPNVNNVVNLGAPTRYFENTYTTDLNSNLVDSVFGEFSGTSGTDALLAGEYSTGNHNLRVGQSFISIWQGPLAFHADNGDKMIMFGDNSTYTTYSGIRANPIDNRLQFTNDGVYWYDVGESTSYWQLTSNGVQPNLGGRHVVPNGSGSDVGRQYNGQSWRQLNAYDSINMCYSFTNPYALLSMTHSGNASNLISAYDFNLWWQFYDSNANDRRLVFSGDTIKPYVNNSVNLGSNSNKFLSISTSVINLNGVYRSSWPTSEWSGTATSNLNMGSWGIYLGGVYRTSWPSAEGMSNPATATLQMNTFDICEVDTIKGLYSHSKLQLTYETVWLESSEDMKIDCYNKLLLQWSQGDSFGYYYRIHADGQFIYPNAGSSGYGDVCLGKYNNRFLSGYFRHLYYTYSNVGGADIAELQFVNEDVQIGDIVELGDWDSDDEEIAFKKELDNHESKNGGIGTSYTGMQGKWKKASKRSKKCPSIVSTEPGQLLGSSETRIELYNQGKMKPIALKGSVPMVYIEGSFESGDILVSAGNGHAMVDNEAKWHEVVAYAKRSGKNERCEVWVK